MNAGVCFLYLSGSAVQRTWAATGLPHSLEMCRIPTPRRVLRYCVGQWDMRLPNGCRVLPYSMHLHACLTCSRVTSIFHPPSSRPPLLPINHPHPLPPPAPPLSSGIKSPSPFPPVYEPWGADVFHTSKKIPHIAAHVDLPGPLLLSPRVYSQPTAVSASSNESLTAGTSVRDRLPPVLIVNLQVRSFPGGVVVTATGGGYCHWVE